MQDQTDFSKECLSLIGEMLSWYTRMAGLARRESISPERRLQLLTEDFGENDVFRNAYNELKNRPSSPA